MRSGLWFGRDSSLVTEVSWIFWVGLILDPAAHGMGAPKGSNGDRLGRLCASNDHLHSTHIRNHRPRIKQIWICVSSEPTRSHHVRGPCPIFSRLIPAWVPVLPG